MTRISTFTMHNYNTTGLLNAQKNVNDALTQSSTEKVATDLKGYGTSAGRLVNTQGVLQKLEAKNANLGVLSARAEIESTAYTGFTDAIQSARDAISNAVANNTGVGLADALEGALASAMESANMKYAGEYIFGGIRSDNAPLTNATLDTLAAQPNTDTNWTDTGGSAKMTIDEGYSVEISQTAEDVFRPFVDFLRNIREWENTNGAMTGKLTDAQSTYLKSVMTDIKSIQDNAIDAQSYAGTIQGQIENKYLANEDQMVAVKKVISNTVDVDLAEVASRLSAAQTQYQAMASIFAQTKSLNLLQYLD